MSATRTLCGFNPDPKDPTSEACADAATHHIRRHDGQLLTACGRHALFTLVHTAVADWHRWKPACGTPGAIWHPSRTKDQADGKCQRAREQVQA